MERGRTRQWGATTAGFTVVVRGGPALQVGTLSRPGGRDRPGALMSPRHGIRRTTRVLHQTARTISEPASVGSWRPLCRPILARRRPPTQPARTPSPACPAPRPQPPRPSARPCPGPAAPKLFSDRRVWLSGGGHPAGAALGRPRVWRPARGGQSVDWGRAQRDLVPQGCGGAVEGASLQGGQGVRVRGERGC